MRRKRRRPVYYTITSMNDGTVLATYPVRKPADRIMKRDGLKLDEDNVCTDYMGSHVNSFKFDDPGRFRFFDIMANRLNTRRAIRKMVLPEIQQVQSELADLRDDVRKLMAMLSEQAS